MRLRRDHKSGNRRKINVELLPSFVMICNLNDYFALQTINKLYEICHLASYRVVTQHTNILHFNRPPRLYIYLDVGKLPNNIMIMRNYAFKILTFGYKPSAAGGEHFEDKNHSETQVFNCKSDQKAM